MTNTNSVSWKFDRSLRLLEQQPRFRHYLDLLSKVLLDGSKDEFRDLAAWWQAKKTVLSAGERRLAFAQFLRTSYDLIDEQPSMSAGDVESETSLPTERTLTSRGQKIVEALKKSAEAYTEYQKEKSKIEKDNGFSDWRHFPLVWKLVENDGIAAFFDLYPNDDPISILSSTFEAYYGTSKEDAADFGQDPKNSHPRFRLIEGSEEHRHLQDLVNWVEPDGQSVYKLVFDQILSVQRFEFGDRDHASMARRLGLLQQAKTTCHALFEAYLFSVEIRTAAEFAELLDLPLRAEVDDGAEPVCTLSLVWFAVEDGPDFASFGNKEFITKAVESFSRQFTELRRSRFGGRSPFDVHQSYCLLWSTLSAVLDDATIELGTVTNHLQLDATLVWSRLLSVEDLFGWDHNDTFNGHDTLKECIAWFDALIVESEFVAARAFLTFVIFWCSLEKQGNLEEVQVLYDMIRRMQRVLPLSRAPDPLAKVIVWASVHATKKGAVMTSRKLRQMADNTRSELDQLIAAGESKTTEFKASLRYDIRQKTINDALVFPVLKTIAAFMNSVGGNLLIGVHDDTSICGIGDDAFESRDAFQRWLADKVKASLQGCNPSLWSIRFLSQDSLDVALVQCERAPKPVFCKEKGREVFYVREASRTRALGMAEFHEYARKRFR